MPTDISTRPAPRLLAALTFIALLAFPRLTLAQRATGTIAGKVTTAGGGPVADATITVWNEAIAVERRATSGVEGEYTINDLPVQGLYSVRVELGGFGSMIQRGVTLIESERAIVDFMIRPSTEERLVVTGRVPVLEQERSAVQQVISEALTHTLPNVGRDFIAVSSLVPAFSGNPNYPSPLGQPYWSNNVLVDGASHFSKWRGAARTFYSGYSLDSIREVQVLSSQFSAEFGETLATITSATTNSGGNEHHGAAQVYVQHQALSDIPAFTTEETPFNSERFGVSAGGPIVRDRTHYFVSYEGLRTRDKNIVTSPMEFGALTRSDQDEHIGFFKIDHKNTMRDLLTVRYNGQWFRWHDEPSGLALAGTGTQYTNDVHTALVSHTTLVSNATLNQFRFQFSRYRDKREDLDPSLYVARLGYSEQGGVLGPLGSGAEPEDTFEAADTLAYKHRAHAMKIGGGFKHTSLTNPSLAYGRGAYFFGGDPSLYPLPFAFVQGIAPDLDLAIAEPRSLAAFAFVQDDWRATSNLTLNVGVRYDVERIANVRNFTASADANNVQPRVGVAWEPIDQRLVIRGGAGLYTQQHLLNYINRVQLEGVGGTATITLPLNAETSFFPNVLTPAALALYPRDVIVLANDFRNPFSVQASAGVEQSYGDLLVSADFVYLRGHALMSLVDTNAPASFSGSGTRSVAAADQTRPIVPVAGGYRKIIALGNEGDSWYRGLQLKASESLGPVQLLASYAAGKAEDRANYLLPEDSRNLDAEKARADNDIRHNLSVSAVWQLPGGDIPALSNWTLSGVAQFRSSRPYTITWGDDRNGTTQNDARPGGRNTAHGDTYSTVDLAMAKQFHAVRRIIELRAEAFNILSTINYDQHIGILSSPYFGQAVTAFPTRRIQLAASFRF